MSHSQGRTSFLKKRSKKLLPIASTIRAKMANRVLPREVKVFWFFFSKKNCFLPYAIVGITKLAPSFTPEGQRDVTVLVFV
jgi:hypothetical protein